MENSDICFRVYAKIRLLTVDEGNEQLNPSRDKSQGKSSAEVRWREQHAPVRHSSFMCDTDWCVQKLYREVKAPIDVQNTWDDKRKPLPLLPLRHKSFSGVACRPWVSGLTFTGGRGRRWLLGSCVASASNNRFKKLYRNKNLQVVAGRQPVRHCSKDRFFSNFFLPVLRYLPSPSRPRYVQTTCGLLPFGPGKIVDGLSPRVRCVIATIPATYAAAK